MGNCCGSEAAYNDSVPFHTRPQRPRVTGAGHTLGGSVDEGSGADPRAAAALAAEVYSPFSIRIACLYRIGLTSSNEIWILRREENWPLNSLRTRANHNSST